MKKYVFLIMVATLFIFLPGCDLDDDDYAYRDTWVGFGMIQKDSVAETFTIEMDDGEVLYPVPKRGSWNELKDNDRVLTNFTILGNKQNPDHNEQYYVDILSLRKILYKGILDITPGLEDSIGNDAILVKDKWLKNNMLNFELQYRGGSKTHFINLVKQPGTVTSASEPVVLELRHNDNGDTEHLRLSAIVTFDLSSIKIQGKNSTQFKVIAKGFDGDDFVFTGEYKY